MAKFGPSRNKANYIAFEKFLKELSRNIFSLNLSHCVEVMGIYVKFWSLLPCPLTGVGTGGYFLPLPGPTWSFSTSTWLSTLFVPLPNLFLPLLATSCPFLPYGITTFLKTNHEYARMTEQDIS